mmetsp:Transcript_21346/g.82781  ORF Transcript_21346/g.82781 Transcript_21346/m.82781 type:complete len:218 (+) Transcript_21346:981-1634(+)
MAGVRRQPTPPQGPWATAAAEYRGPSTARVAVEQAQSFRLRRATTRSRGRRKSICGSCRGCRGSARATGRRWRMWWARARPHRCRATRRSSSTARSSATRTSAASTTSPSRTWPRRSRRRPCVRRSPSSTRCTTRSWLGHRLPPRASPTRRSSPVRRSACTTPSPAPTRPTRPATSQATAQASRRATAATCRPCRACPWPTSRQPGTTLPPAPVRCS